MIRFLPAVLFDQALSCLLLSSFLRGRECADEEVRTGEFPRGGLATALDELGYLLEVVSSRNLVLAAQALSLEFGTSFYGCVYLAWRSVKEQGYSPRTSASEME